METCEMSWIIKDSARFYVHNVDHEGNAMLTTDIDAAKRFETKADAKTVQDKYNLGGSIIPA